MRHIFVRHGDPNYAENCLTPIGHLQAKAVAKRLMNEGVEKICASPVKRAWDTALYIAEPLGLEVEQCDFMREIEWGIETKWQGGHPWDTVEDMVSKGLDIMDPNWADKEPFCRNVLVSDVKKVQEGFDKWLAVLGYVREGRFYRVHNGNAKTVAIVSHGGSSSAVLAHLFNLPFPFVCGALRPDFTSVTVVHFGEEDGALVTPTFEIALDKRHIDGIATENVFGN